MAYPDSDPLPYPTLRKEYEDKKNPSFISDIVVLNKQLFTLLRIFLGLPTSGETAFAILDGLTFSPSTPTPGTGTYSSGLVYMNGNFYLFSGTLNEGKYLKPDIRNSTLKKFPDTSVDYIYSDYYCISSNTIVDDMPQFSGDMNQYRFNMTTMKGSTVGKVPVIGGIGLNLDVVRVLTTKIEDGTIEGNFTIGKNTSQLAYIESALTSGQIVKVGATGLISEAVPTVRDFYGKTQFLTSAGTVTHNLNIPIINQVIELGLEYISGVSDSIGGIRIHTVTENSFQFYTDTETITTWNAHWRIRDTR